MQTLAQFDWLINTGTAVRRFESAALMGINHSQREAAGCQLSRQFHPSVSHIEVSVAWLKVSFATLSLSRLCQSD